jgi:hypothetical protein
MPDSKTIGPRRDAGQREPTLPVGHGSKRAVGDKDVGPHPDMAHITDDSKETRRAECDPHLLSKMRKGHVKEGLILLAVRMGRMKNRVAVPDLQDRADAGNLNPRHKPAVAIIQDCDPRGKPRTLPLNPLESHKHIGHSPLRGEKEPFQGSPRATDLPIFLDRNPLLLKPWPHILHPAFDLPCPDRFGRQ